MALTQRSNNRFIYLEVKHYCLWRQMKKPVEGTEAVEVKNPTTNAISTKHGFKYDEVEGFVVKMEKYDTGKKYPTRYFGYKMHILDGAERYVVDMPYKSQFFRRFLKVAANIDFTKRLSITVFKGKKEAGGDELAAWFRQGGATVKNYYTKEAPRGMPQAYQDPHTLEWDFRAQHSWLVERFTEDIVPAVQAAAVKTAPPVPPADDTGDLGNMEPEPEDDSYIPPHGEISDDDVPF